MKCLKLNAVSVKHMLIKILLFTMGFLTSVAMNIFWKKESNLIKANKTIPPRLPVPETTKFLTDKEFLNGIGIVADFVDKEII